VAIRAVHPQRCDLTVSGDFQRLEHFGLTS
jgi:hypothetical protein